MDYREEGALILALMSAPEDPAPLHPSLEESFHCSLYRPCQLPSPTPHTPMRAQASGKRHSESANPTITVRWILLSDRVLETRSLLLPAPNYSVSGCSTPCERNTSGLQSKAGLIVLPSPSFCQKHSICLE